jgi:spermidine synthase
MLTASVLTLPIPKSTRRGAAFPVALLIGIGGLLIPAPDAIRLPPGQKLIHDEETAYHRIFVIDDSRDNSRELRFDQQIESGISLAEPYPTTQKFTKYFQLAFLLRPKMDRVLFIGAGGGIGPRAFAAHDPRLKIEVVDIDERVLALARDYFFLQESENLRLIAQDGRMYLRKSNHTYDCIVLDAFTIGGQIPFHLVTREFLQLCRERLSDNGIFIMNMGSALEGRHGRLFRSMHPTALAVFPNVHVFVKYRRMAGPYRPTNIILIGSNESQRMDPTEWMARAERFDSAAYIQAADMREMIDDLVEHAPPDPRAPLFTDDFAPVDMIPF